MIDLKRVVRAQLLASATLAPMLAWALSDPPHRAVYLTHVSNQKKVRYPAVSLHIDGGADDQVVFAEAGIMYIDIWVPDIRDADDPNLAFGLSGAHRVYRAVKAALHRQHFTGALADTAYTLQSFGEEPRSFIEDYEETQRIFHVGSRYRYTLIPRNAELTVPS